MDAGALQIFYRNFPHVASTIGEQIVRLHPPIKNERVLFYGYGLPYTKPFFARHNNVIAALPASMGPVRWPRREPARTLLTTEDCWPFADHSWDRIYMIHAFDEMQVCPLYILQEAWRTLAPEGGLVLVVPNRWNPWPGLTPVAFQAKTASYTLSQWGSALRHTHFLIRQKIGVLLWPGALRQRWGWIWPYTIAFESWMLPIAGEVLLIYASKHLYQPITPCHSTIKAQPALEAF